MFLNCCCQEPQPDRAHVILDVLTTTQEERPPDSHRSASSMTPEEKVEEKARLQGLVKNFANKAVQGVRCSFVDADTGAVSPATYLVDKSLSQFTVKSDGGRRESCRLSQIQDVHSIEFGNELLPADVLAKFDEESKQRLVMVRHRCEGEGAGRLCVLESNAIEKVKFHTCMRILRLYSQQGSQPAHGSSPPEVAGGLTVVPATAGAR